MTDYEITVISSILFAVETGGNVYGNKDYSNFTEAYTNSEEEHAITIGAGGWMGAKQKNYSIVSGKQILPNLAVWILLALPRIWQRPIGVHTEFQRIRRKQNAFLQLLIQRPVIGGQNQLAAEEMEAYMNEAAALGVTDTAAQMMCANFPSGIRQ